MSVNRTSRTWAKSFCLVIALFILTGCSAGGFSNLRAELTGQSDSALGYVGAGIFRIQIVLYNDGSSPVEILGYKYLEDDSGNRYLAAGPSNANMHLVGSTCEGTDEGFSGTINPNSGAFVPACFELPEATHVTKYLGISDSGSVVFEVELNQTVTQQIVGMGADDNSQNYAPDSSTSAASSQPEDAGATIDSDVQAPTEFKKSVWVPSESAITKCLLNWYDPSCPGQPGVSVGTGKTYAASAQGIIEDAINNGFCEYFETKTYNPGSEDGNSWSCAYANSVKLYVLTGDQTIAEGMYVRGRTSYIVGDGWLLIGDNLNASMASALGGHLVIDR